MKTRLFTLLMLSLLLACGDDAPAPQIVMPSNLQVNITISADGSGKIDLEATAVNANFYTVLFGDATNEFPTKTMNGKTSHTYTESKNYTITVRAHATESQYISSNKNITITLAGGNPMIPTSGYSTPLSYEGMTLVWNDEFEGSSLNSSYWTHEIGNGTNGWGNNELQYYRAENTTVEDGHLIITAKKESFGGKSYTSSRIITKDKKSFLYGRIDIRAALPKGQGIWPALWMLGDNISTVGWPACGEIDIMEMVGGAGREKTVHGTVHWDNNGTKADYGGSYSLSSGIFNGKFYVFSIVWNANKIIWYVDDVKYHEIDITPAALSEFRSAQFFIFNIAVGGNWPGSPDATTTFPQHLIVDYIRVFQ